MQDRIINTFSDLVEFVNIEDDAEIRFIDGSKCVEYMMKQTEMDRESFMQTHMFIGRFADLKESVIYDECLEVELVTWDRRQDTYFVVVEPTVRQYMNIMCNVEEPLVTGSKLAKIFEAEAERYSGSKPTLVN